MHALFCMNFKYGVDSSIFVTRGCMRSARHFVARGDKRPIDGANSEYLLVANEEELLASAGNRNIEFAVDAHAFHLLWRR